MKGQVEWYEVVNIACCLQSFFQMVNAMSQHISLCLEEAYIPTLAYLLQPTLQYLGDISSLLSIEML